MRGASLSPRGKGDAEGAQAGEPGDGSAAEGEQQGIPAKSEEEADSSAPLSPASELSLRDSELSPRGSRDGESAALTLPGRQTARAFASKGQQHLVPVLVRQRCGGVWCVYPFNCVHAVCDCVKGSKQG